MILNLNGQCVNKPEGLGRLRKMVGVRTFFNYFLILALIIPYTTSDKHQLLNRPNSIQKRHFQESTDQGEEPTQQTTSCSSCTMLEEIKIRNLEMIKSEILRRMGFERAPNMTGKPIPQVPPQFLARLDPDLYGMQNDEPQFKTGYSLTEEEDDHVKTQKVLTFAQPYPRLRHKVHDILHFSFSDSITKFHVSNATLYIFIKGAERRPLPDVFVEVFKVKKITDHPDPPGFHRVVAKKVTQPLGRGDWVKVDLTETVSEWFKNSRENHGFVVNATANGKKVAVTDTTADQGKRVPYVEISTLETKRRVRRNLGLNCDEKMKESLCCRYPFMVDFDHIGFDFIIAPKRYNAHMCSGDCPFVTLQKHPHTHLIQISAANSAAQPCCAPRRMSAISMLYFDEHMNVVYGALPGMVVDRCGCS